MAILALLVSSASGWATLEAAKLAKEGTQIAADAQRLQLQSFVLSLAPVITPKGEVGKLAIANDGVGAANVYQIDFLQADKVWSANRYVGDAGVDVLTAIASMMHSYDAEWFGRIKKGLTVSAFNILQPGETFEYLNAGLGSATAADVAAYKAWANQISIRFCYTDLIGKMKGIGTAGTGRFNKPCPDPPAVFTVDFVPGGP